MANHRWRAEVGVTRLGWNRILLPVFGEKVAEGRLRGIAGDCHQCVALEKSLPAMGVPLTPVPSPRGGVEFALQCRARGEGGGGGCAAGRFRYGVSICLHSTLPKASRPRRRRNAVRHTSRRRFLSRRRSAASRPTAQPAARSVNVTRLLTSPSCKQAFPMRRFNLSPLDSAKDIKTAAS